MNEKIVYEDEQVVEEVYEGTLILDGHMNSDQQRKYIFDMMKKDGIEVINEDEYSIGYVGAEDNDGISETQTSKFVVTRTYNKKVPYKVTTEEIYSGEYILDGLRKSEEDMRKEIFEMMKKDGVDVSNEDELSIGYVGADDNDGISETQTSKFVVTREKREKVEQDLDALQSNVELTEEGKIKKLYDELKTLRDRAVDANTLEELQALFNRMNEVIELLDSLVDNSTKNYGAFEEALSDVEKDILAVEEIHTRYVSEYERLLDDMKDIIKERSDSFVNGSTDTQEKTDEINNNLLKRMQDCNDQAVKIKKVLDAQEKDLRDLYKKKERITNDLNLARSLGISAEEFVEITEKLKRRDIIENVVESRGLSEIIATNSKNRKPEDRDKLKEAREEIFREVEKAKKLNEVDSALKSVEALLLKDESAELDGKIRVLLVKPDALANINTKALALPEKVFKAGEVGTNYQPLEAPKDMEEVLQKVKTTDEGQISVEEKDTDIEESAEPVKDTDSSTLSNGDTLNDVVVPVVEDDKDKEADVSTSDSLEDKKQDVVESIQVEEKEETEKSLLTDKYVLYRDGIDDSRYYARNNVFDRFDADRVGEEVRINGAACYEVYPEDAEYIISNANNELSPYIISIEKATIVRENSMNNAKVKVPRELMDVYTFYKDTDKYYTNKPVFDRFDCDPISDGVSIDGRVCYQMDNEDVNRIMNNADNDYSPYRIDVKEVSLTREDAEQPVVEENPVEERSEETMQNAEHRDLIDRVVFYQNEKEPGKIYAKKNVFQRFDLDALGEPVRINGALCYEMDPNNAEEVMGNANNDYSPYRVDVEEATVERENNPVEESSLEEEPVEKSSEETMQNAEHRDLIDRVVFYQSEKEPEKIYARKYVFERFDVDALGEPVRINGALCYEIDPMDAENVIGNANNDYSPYMVVFENGDIVRNNNEVIENGDEVIVPPIENEEVPDAPSAGDGELSSEEAVPIDENSVIPIVPDPSEEETTIDSNENGNGTPTPEVEDSTSTPSTGDNETTSETEDRTPTPDTEDGIIPPENDESQLGGDSDSNHDVREEIITLYRDVANNNQVYASDDVVHKFGIPVSTPPVEIEGKNCYKISKDTDQIINSIAKMSRDPKFIIKYKNVNLEKEEVVAKPHVEEIIAKLTKDLDIRANDCNRFTASNIRIASSFRNELSSGNIAYNIVHVVPAVIRAGVGLVRKLVGKLLTTERAKNAMTTIQERLNNLSETELEVLFEEYKGSQLKTDMNNQINPLILDKIREFGLSRVERLNNTIRDNYATLFTLLGQVRVLEENLSNDKLSKAEREALEDQRRLLIGSASETIRTIIDSRNKANNLLSSGVHGIEEDFKAVATKLNYVGMRFARDNDFDDALQQRLGNFGRNLNVALSADNQEAIVQNFMGLESCYYENTEIRGSLVGRRSVGSKYYTPMAEQFDYRDDPFIRDLLTTVAVTSATVSAINAVRVHQIESQQIISEQQAQADTINTQNDSTMDYVHQTGQDIAGKRDTFAQGMEAQARQDVLNGANVSERASLDTTGWKFNDAYHAADHASHAAYNQFSDNVTSQINEVTSQYASGAITSAQALERMAQISNGAQDTLYDVVDSSLQILRDYASTHPQFDLHAVEESMAYIVAHPGAIANMNQAMADVTNLAEGLTTLQASHMAALTSLPSDMASTIVCAASGALLAMNVSNSMARRNRKKNDYGDEITSMMDEYLYGAQDEEEMEEERHR